MHTLVVYVPATHLATVKQALFNAGAGRTTRYEHCCWQVQGEGQFRPLPGSKPYLGQEGELHVEPEYRLELICEDDCLESAIKALHRAHPYEEPAWMSWPVRST